VILKNNLKTLSKQAKNNKTKRARDNTKQQYKTSVFCIVLSSLTDNLGGKTSVKAFFWLFSLFLCNSYIEDNNTWWKNKC